MKALNEDEKKFVLQYNKRLCVYMALASVIFSASMLMFYHGSIDLTPKNQALETFEDRMTFTLRTLAIQLVMVVVQMYYVIWQRINTPALDPLNGYEHITQKAKNILNNSLEQLLVFAFSLLILATQLDPIMLGRMIPGLNLIYFIGRVVYWIGYPRGRGLGFALNSFAIALTVSLNLYSFVQLYF